MIAHLFTEHPHSVGESYAEHAVTAVRFGGAMIGGGFACLIHALVPALFTRTGSTTVRRLHARVIARSLAMPRLADPQRSWSYEI